jgi:hypothetical protein
LCIDEVDDGFYAAFIGIGYQGKVALGCFGCIPGQPDARIGGADQVDRIEDLFLNAVCQAVSLMVQL